MKTNSEIKMVIGIVVACAVLLSLFVIFAPKNSGTPARDASLLVRNNSHMTGQIGAKVTLVEFGDYQCPACATLAPYLKQIVDQYKNNSNFNFVYRHFPLSQHANAIPSAIASEAAGLQGKFWEMSEVLYAKQGEWAGEQDPTALFVSYAQTLGLDVVKFKADLANKDLETFIRADLADAQALLLDHTPFIFLNGVEVKDFSSLKAQIDSALAK